MAWGQNQHSLSAPPETRVTRPPSISTSADPSTSLTGSTTRPPLRIVLSGFDTCVPAGSHADKFGLTRVAVLLKKSEVRRRPEGFASFCSTQRTNDSSYVSVICPQSPVRRF